MPAASHTKRLTIPRRGLPASSLLTLTYLLTERHPNYTVAEITLEPKVTDLAPGRLADYSEALTSAMRGAAISYAYKVIDDHRYEFDVTSVTMASSGGNMPHTLTITRVGEIITTPAAAAVSTEPLVMTCLQEPRHTRHALGA